MQTNEIMMGRLAKVSRLQAICIAHATSDDADNDEYIKLRQELINDNEVRDILPQFIRCFNDLSQFWNYIRPKFKTYKERREFIWGEFRPLCEAIEQNTISAQPADNDISSILINFDAKHVRIAWEKALERRDEDPEAAITMARTLIESVCKHILDEARVSYGDKNDDLPKLYKETAKQLNMAPEQYQEEVFKQILGGCHSVIQGLGELRNKLGDAHGKGKKAVKPSPRHATLAVNLAGSMAAFLVATWEERSSK